MSPPHPGTFVREEILEELGLSVTEAAKELDVRRASLSDLINGNAALSAEMALRIEKAFGVKMETLLNMQAWHDAYTMRQRERDRHQALPSPDPRAALMACARALECPVSVCSAYSHALSGTPASSSSSHTVAVASEGARQSPRGDSEPPDEIFGPLGRAERLNWLSWKKR